MSWTRTFFIFLLRCVRPLRAFLLPPSCRFFPTCSRYSEQALQRHSLVRAVELTVRRLLKCHPFHPGGYDPCPSSIGDHG